MENLFTNNVFLDCSINFSLKISVLMKKCRISIKDLF